MGRVRSRGGAVAALVAGAAVLSVDAGAAAAATSRTATFRVTLTGSISSAVNTHPDPAARCRPASEIGLWRLLTFHSARPTVVTVIGARRSKKPVRFVRGKLRRLVGEIHLAAPSQYELVCQDGTRRTVAGEYFTGSTAWRGGVVRLRSPRRGRIVLGPLRGVPEDPSGGCGQRWGAPQALALAPGRLAEAKLLNPRLKRLVVQGGRRRSARPLPTCAVSESVEWKLVFRRVSRKR